MMQFWKPTAIPEVIFSKLILAKFQGLERERYEETVDKVVQWHQSLLRAVLMK